MRGLRKREDFKFERFFAIVQEEAARNGSVFFLDCEEGEDCETEEMELSRLSGWLIPEKLADEFEREFKTLKSYEFSERWEDYFCFVHWENKNNPKITFS